MSTLTFGKHKSKTIEEVYVSDPGIENRARIIFEVVETILSSLPSSQVGIRLSPYGDTFGCKDSTPTETYGYVVNKLNDYDLAYLHVIERRGMHAANVQAPEVGVTRHFRDAYKGVLLTAAGYDREDALKTVEEGAADLVAFGAAFIASPDLVERLRDGAELNAPNMKTFYPQPGVPLESGYTDYPFLTQQE
ncbi:12-oxophytodienoate reductase 1 [Phytophthora pseudosyringae]|uniref:12-oxophytodienoate reductase 1 n=1 Tax=Phytophthora pseudosyringae TaxID=221518 RepID=A0A8T1W6C6_9STRA|nr:12-oxophytodienoate reductase 1 [Phytophthora pseudosyringae]